LGGPVYTEAEVEAWLDAIGCSKTGEKSDTGTFWLDPSKRPFQVPFSSGGYYPEEFLRDLDTSYGLLGDLFRRRMN
jgi:hypothetical protein